MMRKICAAALAAALFVPRAFAGEAPLPAGKPAGVKQAQGWDSTTVELIGFGALGVGIALALSGSGSGDTSGTSPATGGSSGGGTTGPSSTFVP
jgi:hypothetical protein